MSCVKFKHYKNLKYVGVFSWHGILLVFQIALFQFFTYIFTYLSPMNKMNYLEMRKSVKVDLITSLVCVYNESILWLINYKKMDCKV